MSVLNTKRIVCLLVAFFCAFSGPLSAEHSQSTDKRAYARLVEDLKPPLTSLNLDVNEKSLSFLNSVGNRELSAQDRERLQRMLRTGQPWVCKPGKAVNVHAEAAKILRTIPPSEFDERMAEKSLAQLSLSPETEEIFSEFAYQNRGLRAGRVALQQLVSVFFQTGRWTTAWMYGQALLQDAKPEDLPFSTLFFLDVVGMWASDPSEAAAEQRNAVGQALMKKRASAVVAGNRPVTPELYRELLNSYGSMGPKTSFSRTLAQEAVSDQKAEADRYRLAMRFGAVADPLLLMSKHRIDWSIPYTEGLSGTAWLPCAVLDMQAARVSNDADLSWGAAYSKLLLFPEDPTSVAGLEKKLNSDPSEVTVGKLNHFLVSVNPPLTPAFSGFLKSDYPVFQIAALKGLVENRIRDRRFLPLLRKLGYSPDSSVMKYAIMALSDTLPGSEKSMPVYLRALDDRWVQDDAANALKSYPEPMWGRIADEVKKQIEFAAETERSLYSESFGLLGYFAENSDPFAFELVHLLKTHPSVEFRQEAAQAIRRVVKTGAPHSTFYRTLFTLELAKLLRDEPSWKVRNSIAECLTALTGPLAAQAVLNAFAKDGAGARSLGAFPGHSKTTVPLLAKLLRDKDFSSDRKREIADALRDLGPLAEAAVPELAAEVTGALGKKLEFILDEDPGIFIKALGAIGKNAEVAVPTLEAATNHSPYRDEAYLALTSYGTQHDKALNLLLDGLNSNDPDRRKSVAIAIRESNSPLSIAFSSVEKVFAEERNPETRRALIHMLPHLRDETGAPLRKLKEYVASGSKEDRMIALSALGYVKEMSPDLVSAIRDRLTDLDPGVAFSATELLSGRGDATATARIAEMLFAEKDPVAPYLHLNGLGEGASAIVPILREGIHNSRGSPLASYLAYSLLGAAGPAGKEAIPELREKLDSPKDERYFAALALASLDAQSAEHALPLLVELLKGKQLSVGNFRPSIDADTLLTAIEKIGRPSKEALEEVQRLAKYAPVGSTRSLARQTLKTLQTTRASGR